MGDASPSVYLVDGVPMLAKTSRFKPGTSRSKCMDCVDCGMPARLEYFVVRNEVWAATGISTPGECLCIGCVEQRIGRRLVPDDFPECLVNDPSCPWFQTSPRHLARLRRGRRGHRPMPGQTTLCFDDG